MTDSSDYKHGFAAGEMHARLDGHDRALARVNGNLERMTESIGGLSETVSHLRAEVATRETVHLAVTDALTKEKVQGWTRRERLLGFGLFLVTVGSFVHNVIWG